MSQKRNLENEGENKFAEVGNKKILTIKLHRLKMVLKKMSTSNLDRDPIYFWFYLGWVELKGIFFSF